MTKLIYTLYKKSLYYVYRSLIRFVTRVVSKFVLNIKKKEAIQLSEMYNRTYYVFQTGDFSWEIFDHATVRENKKKNVNWMEIQKQAAFIAKPKNKAK